MPFCFAGQVRNEGSASMPAQKRSGYPSEYNIDVYGSGWLAQGKGLANPSKHGIGVFAAIFTGIESTGANLE